VATTFRLARNDLSLEDWQQLCACVPVMLQQPSNYKAAVHLMMQFEVRWVGGVGAADTQAAGRHQQARTSTSGHTAKKELAAAWVRWTVAL
jgi:hypothetical protein